MSKKRDILFLINPKSGVGAKGMLPQQIKKLVDKRKFNVFVEETRYVAHACELAREASQRGVDVVVADGDDSTVLFRRRGYLAYAEPLRWKNLNTMEVADKFAYALGESKDKLDMLFCDVGNMGAGVIDRVQQLGFNNISEIAFQSAAMENKRYENIRAEMYFKLKEWLERGGALPNEPGLREELSKIQYKYSKHGRLVLTPKEEIKEKLNRSPDMADALALTFARPVALKSRNRGGLKGLVCNTEYCIMDVC